MLNCGMGDKALTLPINSRNRLLHYNSKNPMKKLFLLAAILLLFLVSGCATAPINDIKKSFSTPPKEGTGRLLISGYRIPNDEPGVLAFYLLSTISGVPTSVPYYVDIFDVTDDVRHIGQLWGEQAFLSRGDWNHYNGGWLEYDAPPGKRILMLTSVQDIFGHSDFIEVKLSADNTQHVSLSQHGISRYPYFGLINLNEAHYQFCSGLKITDEEELRQAITTHMKQSAIDSKAWDFANYCFALAKNVSVVVPNAAGLKRFGEIKSKAAEKFSKDFHLWQKQPDKNASYDLMKLYEETKTQAPSLVNPTGTASAATPQQASPDSVSPALPKQIAPDPATPHTVAPSTRSYITKIDVSSLKNASDQELSDDAKNLSSSLVAKLKEACIEEVNGFPGRSKPSTSSDESSAATLEIKPSAKRSTAVFDFSLYSSDASTRRLLWSTSASTNEPSPINKETIKKMIDQAIKLMLKDQIISATCSAGI
jgi:hypothetical protein